MSTTRAEKLRVFAHEYTLEKMAFPVSASIFEVSQTLCGVETRGGEGNADYRCRCDIGGYALGAKRWGWLSTNHGGVQNFDLTPAMPT